ncbi:sugar porter family MFS transporter [Pseudoduganella lutea]|uniref:MFS transporter n=1 Tax=Pseudoduganella lutea TaxID=321985 RepID=A0A4P6KTY0_9BURK|nr:sugar porter family MFS transporter [Pseudoduganella lutea]QBE61872.1 MFS transporter [Pseudoduganella lutea]
MHSIIDTGPAPADQAGTPAGDAPVNLRALMLLGLAGAFGGIMFGFDIAIITGAGPFIEKQFGLTHLQLGFAFSSLLFGCMLGAAAAGALADRLGRRGVMLWVALLFGATCVASGAATDFTWFNVARFLGGLAVGVVSLAAPVYISEVAPPRLRGRMGALYQMAIVTGILVSYLINYALCDAGPDAWRLMFYTGALPSAMLFALMLASPETPRYLASRGRDHEALRVLARVSGDAHARRELDAIRASLAQQDAGWRALAAPANRRPLLVVLVLAILVQQTGINTVIDYSPMIFRSAGFTLDAALFSTFVVGLANFVFTLLSFWTIDRLGRRPLYITGSIGMALTLAGLAVAAWTGHFEGMLVLALVVLYLFFFAACIGPVFWTLLPELLPNHIRSRAMIVPVLAQWAANAVVVLLFPDVFNRLGSAATFTLLAAFCATQGLFAWFFVPETRNRSLEDIAAGWNKAR